MIERDPIEEQLSVTAARPTMVGHRLLKSGGASILSAPELPESIVGLDERSLWAKGEPFLITAPTGVGKTTFSHNILFRMFGIIEDEFLGMPVQQTDGVWVYVAADRPRQARRSMRRFITLDNKKQLDSQLIVFEGRPYSIAAPGQEEWLANDLVDMGAEGVIIDSLQDVAQGISQASPAEIAAVSIQNIIQAGIEVGLNHHHRKKGQGVSAPKTIDEVYGGQALTSKMGSVISLFGSAGDLTFPMKHLKAPVEQLFDMNLDLDPDTGLITPSDNSASVQSMLALNSEYGITAPNIAVGVFGPEVTANDKKKVTRELKKMKAAGRAWSRGEGTQAHLWYLGKQGKKGG